MTTKVDWKCPVCEFTLVISLRTTAGPIAHTIRDHLATTHQWDATASGQELDRFIRSITL